MSSPKSENHIAPITAKCNMFTNESVLAYSCNNGNNLTFTVAHNNNNNSINNNNNTTNNNNGPSLLSSATNGDKSSLLALNMINQALNFSLLQPNNSNKPLKLSPPIQYPDLQKFNDMKMSSNPNGLLISEYQKIKLMIDKSGMLLPNEKLVTQNRGECYWSNCLFQSDIEDNFKKHLNECHHITSSAIAQLEISFEKAMQLSKLLLQEQNHLYNMFLHLDQKLKSLPTENPSLLGDNQYLLALLNKFKQMPNIFDFFNDSNRFAGDQNTAFHSPHRLDGHQFPLNNANHHTQPTQQLSPHQQPSPMTTVSTLSNIPQQLIENLSTVLMRQQQQQHQQQHHHQQQQIVPLSSQTTNHQNSFQQSISSPPQLSISQPNHSAFTNTILPLINASCNNSNNTNSLLINNAVDASALINLNANNQLANIDNNLKDILSYSRSDSNYPRSDPESNNMKDNKIKPAKRASSNSQLSFFPKGMTDREYYRQFPVRPSASYVNLIKTAILESPRHELSLNEIYVWMQTEFAYFRDKEQKWKNAIRHNLSLHKCFQRKHGKLWTFNENEYNMKKSRNRFQYNVPLPGSENQANDPDSFGDEDDMPEQLEHSEYLIKKEMDFNDENMPDEKHMEVADEWSNYLHKTSLISSSSDDNIKPPDISVD